ncbi:MAG TPA: hypothetical protein VGZ93_07645 [Candidatus Methylacidiphilales bacterium]|jgi:hypothetical protein|nr:hypothetical protein [Candidatus Methylacidiphilales bacterium]
MPDTRLILHVKGTQSETAELPRDVVRAAVSQGQLTHSQLIWSPGHNAWKQIREFPDLLPGRKPFPSPSRPTVAAVPEAGTLDAIIPESPTGSVARVAASAGAPSPVGVATSSKTIQVLAVRPSTPAPASYHGNFTVKEDDEFHPLKWISIGLGIFLFVILSANYFLVQRPLLSNVAQTIYSNVDIFGHYAAFMQPTVIVIHVPASTAITPDNISDFIATLAHSTPQNPITGNSFERVALTSGWAAQYTFSGESWKQLGDMKNGTAAVRKDFILDQIKDASGQSLLLPSTATEQAQQARRNEVWKTLTAQFVAKP